MRKAGAESHATAAAQAQRKRRHRTRPASSRSSPASPTGPRRRDGPKSSASPPIPSPRRFLKYAPTYQPLSVLRSGRSRPRQSSCSSGQRAWMGGPSMSTGRRRWSQRSCRTGGGGVVRRTVPVPAPDERGVGAAPRRAKGLAHVDKQQRVHGILSDPRSSSGSTAQEDYHCSDDFWEFRRKRSSGNSTKCLSGEHIRIEIESHQSVPSVMAELMDFDAATGVLIAAQKTPFMWPRESKIPSNEKMLHASSTVSNYGLPYRLEFHLGEDSSNVKHTRPLKNSSGISKFSYRLARIAGRSDSMKMGPASAKCSLSEKMSMLRQPQHGSNYQNQNSLVVLNQRHNNVHFRGALNMFRKEEIIKQTDSSTGRHWQTLLDNALVRQNQFCCPQAPKEELSEQLWSYTNSESEKVVCFSSCDSDTSETSDNSKLSSLCVVANDQWKMTFKKVRCPLAACIDSMPVTNLKEIDQPSPVSVLEPPAEDFSDAENIKLDATETVVEVADVAGYSDYLCSELNVSQDDGTIQLVQNILEGFGDEEERDFSYLLDILIASGIHGTEEDQLYKVCQSLDCPAGYDVFEKLEKKYMKVAQWSRSDRKLIFDMVNSILSEIFAPCLDMHPWVKTARNMAPVWGSEGLLEKILRMLAQRREELAPSEPRPAKKAFDQKWPDLSDCIDKAGRDVEKMIKEDLLDELLLELMFS